MTLATSGRSSPTPFAFYDPASSSLRTSQGTFPWASIESSLTLPRWGSMRSGELFERATSGRAISAPACSSLLLTPTRGDGEGGGRANPPPRGEGTKDGSGGLREQVRYLPTPAAQEPGGTPAAYHERLRQHDGRASTFTPLSMLVQTLPTPTAGDAKAAANRTAGRSNPNSSHHDGVTLTDAVRMLPTPRTSDGQRGGITVMEDRTSARLLPTPTARDWKDGEPCPAVPVNALLGRQVWWLGASSSPPSDDTNTSSDELLLLRPTSEDG